jgi:hypothetical protein
MFKFIRALFILLVFSPVKNAEANVFQQENNQANVHIPKVSQEPLLSDYVAAMELGHYQNLPGHHIDNLVTRTPINGQAISQKTVIFLSYDKANIYGMFMCFDDAPNLIRSTVSARDEFAEDEDTVALHLIPFANSQQMYGFQSNAVGSQIDGMFSEGAGWDLSFDPIWFTESAKTKNGYLIKIKLPISSLRFPPGDLQNWGFFVYRGIPRNNEDAFYPQYSTGISSRISQAGLLENIDVARKTLKIEATPFVTTTQSRSKSSADHSWRDINDNEVGLDAKFIWDDRIVLDLTLNPDFSQVESDEPQIVTNERFETFFPEKRPFFLENADYFSTPLNLLFTRKIVNPNAGIRTTAQIGDLSIGGMLIDDENLSSEGQTNSNANIIVTNLRQSFGYDSYLGLFISDYSKDEINSKNVALQTRFRLNENWVVDSQLAYSDNSNVSSATAAGAWYLTVNGAGQYWRYSAKTQSIAREFDTPIGYIPRKDITDISQQYSYRFLTNNQLFIAYTTEFELQNIWDAKGNYIDQLQSVAAIAEMPGQTFFKFKATSKNERLGPKDYAELSNLTLFNQDNYLISAESSWFSLFGLELTHKRGDAINYHPVQGVKPDLSKLEQNILISTYRASSKLKFEIQLLESSLNSRLGDSILHSKQYRLKSTYQFNQDWSIRMIVEEKNINTNSSFSSLSQQKTTISDLLLKWESNPGDALFIGYGTFQDDYEKDPFIPEITEQGKSLFLKFSHRFNY